MTELLVGTKKGLFRLEGDAGDGFEITARAFAGQSVEYAMRDPRTGRYLASVTSWFYGPKIWVTDDPTGEWEQAEGTTLPEGDEKALERIWVIAPGEADGLLYAGGDPGPLFESRDGGLTWALNSGLWGHPTRPDWNPGNGGLCLHTIAPWPGDSSKLLVAISAVGVWLTDDGGETWRHSNEGIVPDYVPEETRDQNPIQHCVHDVRRAPGRPERLFMQFHGGVYRSDDGGGSWLDIGEGLPSDFGFPIVVDPADPDSAYVIPLIGAEDRTPPRRGGAGLGDPRRRRVVAGTRRGPPRARVPHHPPRGLRQLRRGRRPRALLRRDVRRSVRFEGRRRELDAGRRSPPARVLGTHGVGSCRRARAPARSRSPAHRHHGSAFKVEPGRTCVT